MHLRSFSVALFSAPLLLNACSGSEPEAPAAGASVPPFSGGVADSTPEPGPEQPGPDDSAPGAANNLSSEEGDEGVGDDLALDPGDAVAAGDNDQSAGNGSEEPSEVVTEGPGEGLPAGPGEGLPEEPGENETGGGDWRFAENPGADCAVGPLPTVGSLSAAASLPDPFTKLDGTRMTDRSEWLCRREEIRRQAHQFIYGDKPVPAEGSVTGSVSNNSISVQVNEGGNSTSFSVNVNMNGATAPAPAIIQFSGLPVPNGVATISFRAVETTGDAGPKSGPFYDFYGSNHPAGYLVAHAWQVSRILDVLQQNPSVIDPARVGVTGCSRSGKGAFVAGALDNRIALTIPVESGLGGTVALRLVERLDAYNSSERPYHGISYVRWMSEVALGQFTTGNTAAADNTDRLPIDMHEMMALIAPRGLFIADNPSTDYPGLDRNSAWVTANVGKMIFEGLGVGDHFEYQGASGGHCNMANFRYPAALQAMISKFLLGDDSANTGNVVTDLGNPPNPNDYIDWDVPVLSGEL